MAAIRSRRNRTTELALATAFRRAEIKGWRRHLPLPGRPDFAFPEFKVAVFVDGCFWHGCAKHGRIPKSNVDYWKRKLLRNKKRDSANTRALRSLGWKVIRLWEHQVESNPGACVKCVNQACKRMGHPYDGAGRKKHGNS